MPKKKIALAGRHVHSPFAWMPDAKVRKAPKLIKAIRKYLNTFIKIAKRKIKNSLYEFVIKTAIP
jgi:hypothetical protein